MNVFLKNLFFFLTSWTGLPRDRAVILMYHSISEWNHFTTVSPAEFERQMSFLALQRKSVISLSELARRIKSGTSLGGSVAITFDDGYRDNYATAYPILKKHNFPATIFVETNLIGRSYDGVPHMTESDMKDAADLIEFGAHTKSHPKLAKLSITEAREEVTDSRKALEQVLQKPCTLFAYPFGSYSRETIDVVRGAGLEVGVTVQEGTVSRKSELLELPRVSIDQSTTFIQFRGKLTRAIDIYQSLKI